MQQHHRYLANVSHPIAESRTGRILSAIDRCTGDTVALKFVFVPNSENNGLSHPQLRETAVWGMISAHASAVEEEEEEKGQPQHGNHIPILKLIDVFSSGASVVYVSKRIKHDLHSFLTQYRHHRTSDGTTTVIDLATIKNILSQILTGVDFLHRECNVVHRDLKPHNIFVEFHSENEMYEPRVYIGDFGLSRCCAEIDDDADGNQTTRPMTHEVVSRAYRAPELLLGCGRCLVYTGNDNAGPGRTVHLHSVDMWSVGCIAVDLISSLVAVAGGDADGKTCSPLPPSLFAASSGSDLEQLGKIYDLIGTPTQQLQQKLMTMMKNQCNNSKHNNNHNNFFISFSPRSPLKGWSEEIAKSYLPRSTTKEEIQNFADFIQKLLCNDPSERMTAHQALKHPFLESTATTTTTKPMTEAGNAQTCRRIPWFAVSDKNNSSNKKMDEFLQQ